MKKTWSSFIGKSNNEGQIKKKSILKKIKTSSMLNSWPDCEVEITMCKKIK